VPIIHVNNDDFPATFRCVVSLVCGYKRRDGSVTVPERHLGGGQVTGSQAAISPIVRIR
jgi:hypothetical protein